MSLDWSSSLLNFAAALAVWRFPAPSTSGVYAIHCVLSGKAYVGSSKDIASRRYQHLSDLRHGQANRHLQNAWDKYPHNTFRFYILEYAAPDELFGVEQYWLDTLGVARGHGYNISPTAGSVAGVRFTEAGRARVRAALLNRRRDVPRAPQTEATKAKRRAWWRTQAAEPAKTKLRERNSRG